MMREIVFYQTIYFHHAYNTNIYINVVEDKIYLYLKMRILEYSVDIKLSLCKHAFC